MSDLKKDIDIAIGKVKAPLVLKNGFVINVFTQSIEKNDIAVNDDKIVGVGNYVGEKQIDCTGLFIAPGFIDAHVHIESSMVTPEVFSQLLLKRGVTTAVADPHEIGNVLGPNGIEFMLENSKKSVMDIFFMLPSCVPATEFEDSGAVLNAEELAKFIDHEKVLGLGEVMDTPAVVNGREDMLKKLEMFNEGNIDGHCPGISQKWLNAYLCCRIKTDHECSKAEEALKKVQRGMYVMLREGSATKNLKDLLPAVNKDNFSRFLFCTDDRHIEDLIEEGTIDNSIRLSIKQGLDPIKAYTIASYNAAACYGLKDRGALAPGYKADLVIFEDLCKLNIKHVIKNGEIYNKEISFSNCKLSSSVKLDLVSKEDFLVRHKCDYVNTIKLIPNSVETVKQRRKVTQSEGIVLGVESSDCLKIAVFERHKNTGKKSVGFVEGFGLKNCSIAQSIAHDSHNIIVIGDKDEDMALAVNTIIDMEGGIALVSDGKVLGKLNLPIGGLITSENPYDVLEKIKKLNNLARSFGVKKDFDPFLTLGFLALPVIPDLKITARGLFHYEQFRFIDLFN
ncbi:adenine deaminase [Clostridium sp. YIM B02515]|uniref:Adenine deaminase n=1 Tax=Clostridium rhizosphaerae TaxID=2803861 RepID=A0ABS1TG51_9CLOT|nr:adenine deaminase [Clostridium rhizosphaerae]MBL4938300.1 adenine deaminase [Clostridium rhizosphaerae]